MIVYAICFFDSNKHWHPANPKILINLEFSHVNNVPEEILTVMFIKN